MDKLIDFLSGNGTAWGVALMPPAVYVFFYLALRLGGKLAVAGGGWHASVWHFRGRVAVSALFLFSLFQPLLRGESALRRRVAALRRREPAISDVVVEVIPLA